MKQSSGIHIFKLFSSNFAAQVLVVLTTPVMTRLFSASHFGLVQIFESLAALFCCIAGFKYELAIPLGREQQEATASFLLSLMSTGLLAGLSLVGVLAGGWAVTQWFHAPELYPFLWLLPFVISVYGLFNALIYWASRDGRFEAVAWASFGSTTGDRLIAITIGKFILPGSVLGLVIGRLAGIILYAAILLGWLGKTVISEIRNAHLTWQLFRNTARQHRVLPLFKTWNALFTMITVQFVTFIVGHYFPTSIVGHYSLAIRIVSLPTTLLGVAVAQVFFPAASQEYQQTGALVQIVTVTFTRLVQIGVFPMLMVGFFGADLFAIVFGAQWRLAGVYAQLLAAWQLLSLLNFPMDIFTIVNRQKLELGLVILNFAARAGILRLSVTYGSPQTAIGLFGLLGFSLLSMWLFLKFRIIGVSVRWACGMILKYAVLSWALLMPVKLVTWWTARPEILFGMLLLVTVIYVSLLYCMDTFFRDAVIGMLKKFRQII